MYDCLEDGGFTTCFVPWEALDDQTITNNPAFKDYYYNGMTTTRTNDVRNPVAQSYANIRGKYVLNHFTPPTSTFTLGLDLDSFANLNEIMRSGRYLATSTVQLWIQGATAFANQSVVGDATTNQYVSLAIIMHDLRLQFEPGGTVKAYY
jgi:hypothetical protein